MKWSAWVLCPIVCLAATAASAQQIQTFTYDVHGRLTETTRSSGGTSQTTSYGLDKVDNRTSRTVSAPSTARGATSGESASVGADITPQSAPRVAGTTAPPNGDAY